MIMIITRGIGRGSLLRFTSWTRQYSRDQRPSKCKNCLINRRRATSVNSKYQIRAQASTYAQFFSRSSKPLQIN